MVGFLMYPFLFLTASDWWNYGGWREAWLPSLKVTGAFSGQRQDWRTPGEHRVSKSVECDIFPSVLWRCWLGNKKGIRPVKRWMLVCWWWRFDWSFACPTASVVTITSIILCSSKIQNGDTLIPAYWGCHEKWLLLKINLEYGH